MKKNNNYRKKAWKFIDNVKDDKVVLMILLLLIAFSILAVFSSTPLLALQLHTTRMTILKSQIYIAAISLGVVLAIHLMKDIKKMRRLSRFGFPISAGLLLFLIGHINIGPIKAVMINQAWRIIKIFGAQFHVFEFVKVLMILYLAWAVHDYKQFQDKIKRHRITDTLYSIGEWCDKKSKVHSRRWLKIFIPLKRFDSKYGFKFIYIYFPIGIITLMIFYGSVSSSMFIGLIMLLTVAVCGIELRDALFMLLFGVVGALSLLGLAKSNLPKDFWLYKTFTHLYTAKERLNHNTNYYLGELDKNTKYSKEWNFALDKIRQPESAKIAIHEGGLLGKGPGKSTQRYIVPVIFEDYMYSFIVEEYGILGGIIIILLYTSLLARGTIIARNCTNIYAKSAVAGLVLLITGQSMMHMCTNVGLLPLTGQTLPMISHGSSSFLAFSIAFGVILNISKMANEQILELEAEAIAKRKEHNASKDDLNDLDIYESPDFNYEDYEEQALNDPNFENKHYK